jgi:hypothetical protein
MSEAVKFQMWGGAIGVRPRAPGKFPGSSAGAITAYEENGAEQSESVSWQIQEIKING